MANNEINGRDIIISLDPTGVSTFRPVVCLTSNTITNSLTSLDASSKCGNKFVAGAKFESSISGEGFLIDPDTGTPTNYGYAELFAYFTQKRTLSARFGKATPTTGDYIYSGDVFISELEAVAADDELATFSVTFTAINPPFTQTVTY